MIQFDRLEKKYGTVQAVYPLEFEIPTGAVFGFLGPNGAGKTTTFRMMMGILVPTNGRVLIHSRDCHKDSLEVKRLLGYLPDQPSFYDYLRGIELLIFVAQMHGFSKNESRQRAEKLLDEMGLVDAAEEFAMNYSLGMKKKLALAMAMIHGPKVLLLDEPMNGLDPRASLDLQNRLVQFSRAGGTVLLSTHLLDVVEKVCTHVGIIHKGKIVDVGTVLGLKENAPNLNSMEQIYLNATKD